MISKKDMMGVLLEACPSFDPEWKALQDEWRDEADGPPLYLALADLARHLIGKLGSDQRDDPVERLARERIAAGTPVHPALEEDDGVGG